LVFGGSTTERANETLDNFGITLRRTTRKQQQDYPKKP
jgi:hypothetical protein